MPTTINDVRFSYCNLFQPQVRPGGKPEEAKYSVTVLVPKSNAQAKVAIDTAIQDAINAGVSKTWGGQRPPVPALCVHDGDGVRPSDGQAYGEECKGYWVFTASSKQPPFVVDQSVQPVIDPREVYSGMWGNISVNFFAYNNSGKKGIGCGLNGIQKTRDGEALTSRVTAEDAFAPVAPVAPMYGHPGAYTPPVAAPMQAPYPAQQPVYAPSYQPPYIDPITGQPFTPSGTPSMGA